MSFTVSIDLKKIFRAFEKNDMDRAFELLEEARSESPDHPAISYLYSKMMTSDTLDMYDLDSAKLLIDRAISWYKILEPELVEEMNEVGINKQALDEQYDWIKQEHLSMALEENTLAAFDWFLTLYPEFGDREEFTRRRDSIYYFMAERLDTWQSYWEYYQNYSHSIYASRAKDRFDHLIYKDRTAGDHLDDYKEFLSEFPGTPYRDQIEKVIFERTTASHTTRDYLEYGLKYPNSKHKWRGYKLNYYLDRSLWYSFIFYLDIDSMLQQKNLESHYLIPILEDNQFGFMDMNGSFQLMPQYDSIVLVNYKCNPLENEIIPVIKGDKKIVINRTGDVVYGEGYDLMKDLGAGILLIYRDGIGMLFHKTGLKIMEGVANARVLKDRWIKVLKDGYWGLYAPNGQLLAEHMYDEIKTEGDFWMFRKDDLWGITSPEEILEQINEKGISLEYKFEDIELINDRLLIGFNKGREALLDADLHFLIPWDDHIVFPDTVYYYSRKDGRYKFFNEENQLLFTQEYDYLVESEHWFGLRTESNWTLFDKKEGKPFQSFVDSVHLFNRFAALVYRSGYPFVVFPNHTELPVFEDSRVTTLLTPDRSHDYLLFASETSMSVWNNKGILCFYGDYEDINCLGKDLFKVKRRGKEGVVDIWGNELLPLEYDHIQVRGEMLNLIKRNKIGGFDLQNGSIIPARFDSRISKIENKYVTRINARYGLLDSDGTELTPFVFNEIKAWNDTAIWARTDTTWQIRDMYTGKIHIDNVIGYKPIAGNATEQFFIAQSEDGFGVISDVNGLILPLQYNNILNVGTEDIPVFFVEESFPDAEFYVVMYADQTGRKLWSEAYRNNIYNKIYCDR